MEEEITNYVTPRIELPSIAQDTVKEEDDDTEIMSIYNTLLEKWMNLMIRRNQGYIDACIIPLVDEKPASMSQ